MLLGAVALPTDKDIQVVIAPFANALHLIIDVNGYYVPAP